MFDFSQVQADDALLDDLGAAKPAAPAGDEVALLLLLWRNSVDAIPIGELASTRLAVATVRAARERRRRGSCA